jgi:hypothetical protein
MERDTANEEAAVAKQIAEPATQQEEAAEGQPLGVDHPCRGRR